MKEYQPLVRPAILTGFLGYALVVVGLLYDLGRPWRLPYPMMLVFGTTSVLFEVGWCVALYLLCQAIEMLPPVFEWLGYKRLRTWAVGLTVGATVMAVVLSTLHQSSLGALFLIAPGKLHPLWYSMYLPVFFICLGHRRRHRHDHLRIDALARLFQGRRRGITRRANSTI